MYPRTAVATGCRRRTEVGAMFVAAGRSRRWAIAATCPPSTHTPSLAVGSEGGRGWGVGEADGDDGGDSGDDGDSGDGMGEPTMHSKEHRHLPHSHPTLACPRPHSHLPMPKEL